MIFPPQFAFLNNPTNTAQPVDQVFDWSLSTSHSSVAQFNASMFGGAVNAVSFDSGGAHDPSTAFLGVSGNLMAFRTPVKIGGTTYTGSAGGWTLKRDATVAAEEAYFSLPILTHTKILWAGFIQFNIPPADNTSVTDLDHIYIDTTGGAGGFLIGQEAFSTGHGTGLETGNPTAFGARVPVTTGVTYYFNLYGDTGAGTATWVMWNPAANWNQIGLESTAALGGADILAIRLCAWDGNTITGGDVRFGSMFVAYDGNAILPSQAVLGLRSPDNFAGVPASWSSVSLSWTAVSQASSYNIDQSSDGGSTWSRISTSLAATSLSVTGLTVNQAYIYRISSNVGSLTSNTVNSNSVTPITVDMKGWWKLGEGNTALATDFSGNGFNGTFPNGSTRVTGVGGVAHANHMTNGGGDFLNLGNPSGLVITAALTFSMWVNFDTWPQGAIQLATKFQASNEASYAFVSAPNGGGGFLGFANAVGTGPSWPNIVQAASQTFSPSTWYMVSYVFDGANKLISVYVNGVQEAIAGTTDSAIADSAGAEVLVGVTQANYGFGSTFVATDMAIQDVRIWNRALSTAEILGVFNTGAQSAG